MQTTGNARIVQEIPQLLDAAASPLIAEQEVLEALPKTYILTCEHDVLRDDGIMYAKRLESAGVNVTLDHFEDGFHGCMIFTSWPTNFSVGIRTRNSYIKWLDQNLWRRKLLRRMKLLTSVCFGKNKTKQNKTKKQKHCAFQSSAPFPRFALVLKSVPYRPYNNLQSDSD